MEVLVPIVTAVRGHLVVVGSMVENFRLEEMIVPIVVAMQGYLVVEGSTVASYCLEELIVPMVVELVIDLAVAAMAVHYLVDRVEGYVQAAHRSSLWEQH